MALRDQPYLPLYIQDFMTDEKLIECSAESTGVYIRIMCLMHKSEQYGKILLKQKYKQTDKQSKNFAKQLARSMPYDLDTIERSLDELISEGVLILDNGSISQKRMIHDNRISEIRKEAGKKGGDKKKDFAKAKSEANTESEYVNENINENIDKNKEVYYQELSKTDDKLYDEFVQFLFGKNDLKEQLKKCLRMKDQITHERFKKLLHASKNGGKPIKETILNLERHPKKYVSFYLTLNNWIK